MKRDRAILPVSTLSILTVFCIASLGLADGPQRAATAKNIAGLWETRNAQGNSVLMLNADGSGEFNGKDLRWTLSGNVLSLTFEGGSTYMYETVLAGNSLTVNSADLKQPLHFTRSGSGGGAEQAHPVAGGGLAGITGSTKPAATKSAAGPEGTWQVQKPGGTFTLVLNAGGEGTFNGDPIKWEFTRNILTLRWANGDTFMYNAALTPNTLKVSGGNLSAPIDFQRAGGGSSGMTATTTATRPHANAGGGPAGDWEAAGPNGAIHLVLNPNGQGAFGGGAIQWSFNQNTLTLIGPNGTPIAYNASIQGNTMTLSGGGLTAPASFRRSGGGGEVADEGEVEGGFGGGSGAGGGSLAGSWQNQQGSTLQLNPDGSAILNGQRFRYTSDGSTLTLIGADGQLPFPYSLRGNTMTVQVQGQTVVYTRTGGAGGGAGRRAGGFGGGGNPPDMIGKWCWINVSNSGQVSSSSNSCFVLNPDGTYEYSGESSNSNAYGETGSQSYDRGTWSVEGSQVHVNSQQQGQVTYQLVKRNHPKTNDPMLCLDGQCYVTFGPKPPWPY